MEIKKNIILSLKWILICALIGCLSASASAFFLITLEWATNLRNHNIGLLCFLPIGGLLVGLLYHYYGKDVVKGNNLLLEEYENPQKAIPLKMAPFVLFGTIVTHLFGGSAGREGTAVQMGGAIADQFSRIFNLDSNERKTLIILGISAGFASVFGTPLAGAIFALEVVYFCKITLKSCVLSFLVAYFAYYTVELWPVHHTQYSINTIPDYNLENLLWIIPVSALFGLAAMLFSRSTHFWGSLFSKTISYPPLRPYVGGILFSVVIYYFGATKFIGLGIPSIVDAFSKPSENFDFLLKILFTGFTIGAGFKGGEVTPLFFVGATLGSALSGYVPLPIALLAGMGFVAVFSGATHTPIACTVMGIELFGIESTLYIAISCFIAYISSGSIGIYHSQTVKGVKHRLYEKFKRNKFDNF